MVGDAGEMTDQVLIHQGSEKRTSDKYYSSHQSKNPLVCYSSFSLNSSPFNDLTGFDDSKAKLVIQVLASNLQINVTPLPFSPVQFQYNWYYTKETKSVRK